MSNIASPSTGSLDDIINEASHQPTENVSETVSVDEFMRLTNPGSEEDFDLRPVMILADGTTLSVQASHGHYCWPKEINADHYEQVEIYSSSGAIEEFSKYEATLENGVYGYVPTELLSNFAEKHGGILRPAVEKYHEEERE